MPIEARNFNPRSGEQIPSYATFKLDLVGTNATIDLTTVVIRLAIYSTTGQSTSNVYYVDTTYPAPLPSGYTTTGFSYVAITGGYRITIAPDTFFDNKQHIDMFVNADDTDGNSMTTIIRSYTVTDMDRFDALVDLIQEVQEIQGQREQGRMDASRTTVSFGFDKWNRTFTPVIYKNNQIQSSGYTIPYDGTVTFAAALSANDVIHADYKFGLFSDGELIQLMETALQRFNLTPPPSSYTLDNVPGWAIAAPVFGAASLALQRILFSFVFQHTAIIYLDKFQERIGILEKLIDIYNGYFDAFKEAKKSKLPAIGAISVPEYSLPGGRTFAKQGLCQTDYNQYMNFDSMYNKWIEGGKTKVLTYDYKNRPVFGDVADMEYEGKKHVFNVAVCHGDGANLVTNEIQTSMDHKYETPYGMMRLKYLPPGSKVYVKANDGKKTVGRIVARDYAGYEECYEIEVPKYHKFACNNVMGKNSRFFRYLYKGASGF